MYHFKDFEMRPARSSDIAALTEIIRGVFVEYEWIFVTAYELPDFVNFDSFYGTNESDRNPRLFAIEARSTGRLVGCIALKYNEEGPYLSRVYLNKSDRGKGLGKWMVEQVMDIAQNEGFESIHLWTDTRFEAAHHLYRKLGFKGGNALRSLHDVNNSFEWKMLCLFE
jgi:RimJ/RimL family protein N-acetyltransferase